ncbi:hypothetical protein IWZ00DRAFT_545734 [Phyllosticta capitalensis]
MEYDIAALRQGLEPGNPVSEQRFNNALDITEKLHQELKEKDDEKLKYEISDKDQGNIFLDMLIAGKNTEFRIRRMYDELEQKDEEIRRKDEELKRRTDKLKLRDTSLKQKKALLNQKDK